MALTVLTGDALEKLRELPDESVHCCVTSPPYWGLRDYGTAAWEGGELDCDHGEAYRKKRNEQRNGDCGDGGIRKSERDFQTGYCKCGAKRIDSQLGLEKTPEEYVARMVEIFREVRRVLRKDGTLWLNLGDSYAGSWGNYGGQNRGQGTQREIVTGSKAHQKSYDGLEHWRPPTTDIPGLKPKDLCGIPWRVAFALQADGWYLRQDNIWSKPNPMPESVTDRCTKAHEYLFLLTKSPRYFYDAEAIKERGVIPEGTLAAKGSEERFNINGVNSRPPEYKLYDGQRNKRSVWTVATAPYPEAHFATYPPDLIKPCIMAGTSAKGCCAKCGAPWERIVERESFCDVERGSVPSSFRALGQPQQAGVSCSTKTLGWQPTCDCCAPNCGETPFTGKVYGTDPCTVLDPFAGSGTTGAVALELGCKAILIELNPKYVELIKQRCDITPGLQLA